MYDTINELHIKNESLKKQLMDHHCFKAKATVMAKVEDLRDIKIRDTKFCNYYYLLYNVCFFAVITIFFGLVQFYVYDTRYLAWYTRMVLL